mmetsp:Transcript_3358/g.9795  ORF Transcript_3358/g.9795 Transcript_3358/m.9795 type:complete len:317 (-) Transcript_3358:738-1688(-)
MCVALSRPPALTPVACARPDRAVALRLESWAAGPSLAAAAPRPSGPPVGGRHSTLMPRRPCVEPSSALGAAMSALFSPPEPVGGSGWPGSRPSGATSAGRFSKVRVAVKACCCVGDAKNAVASEGTARGTSPSKVLPRPRGRRSATCSVTVCGARASSTVSASPKNTRRSDGETARHGSWPARWPFTRSTPPRATLASWRWRRRASGGSWSTGVSCASSWLKRSWSVGSPGARRQNACRSSTARASAASSSGPGSGPAAEASAAAAPRAVLASSARQACARRAASSSVSRASRLASSSSSLACSSVLTTRSMDVVR